MSPLETWTLGIALLGAALGLTNTAFAFKDRSLRLRVRFLLNYATPDIELIGCSFEVINLSSFPVVIQEVGFSYSPWWRRKLERAMMPPQVVSGDKMPCRLEAREQANFYFNGLPTGITPKPIKAAYAKTACGVYRRGYTPALRELSRTLRS